MNRSAVMRSAAMIIASLLIVAIGVPSPARAYDALTHEAINVGSARASTLEARLRTSIDFANGLAEIVRGKSVLDWIREGGTLEDLPLRFLNHFHQPLRSPWRDAGLNDVLFSGTSSIVWGQDFRQGFSWGNARKAYYDALTLPLKDKRDETFAEAFRSLGQVIHLIGDASVPAHVRNNSHAVGDAYEAWVELQATAQAGEDLEQARERFLTSFVPSPAGPDSSFILTLPILGQDAIDAPVRIARFWDTDQYGGQDPSVTLSRRIGITEYTNANFFSQDTVFANEKPATDKYFSPLPSSADVELWVDTAKNRKYWRRRGAGPDEPQHLATASKRTFWQQSARVDLPKDARLDDNVHEDYARLLLPRAVGYSAALLDYFFRGQLRAVPFWNRRGIRLDIQNLTAETMRGVFELHAIHQDQQEKIATFGSTASPLTLGPFGRTEVSLPTTFTPAKRFALVFQGQLGDESPDAARAFDGAVAGVVFDIEFVFTVQASFDGPLAQFKCAPRDFRPDRVVVLRQEGLQCTWLPRTVRIPGRFVTTADRPIIDAVRLIGGGSRITQPRLIIDGVVQSDGRWQRQDPAQPDPRTFVVEESGIDLPGIYELDVTTRNKTVFETELALINLGGSEVAKTLATNGGSGADRQDLVEAKRGLFSEVELEDSTRDWREAQFRTLQISGVPNPTSFSGTRRFGPLIPFGNFLEFNEGVQVTTGEYDQIVIDHFDTFPGGTGAEEAYDALPGVAQFVDPIPEPGPPDVTWVADVARDYRPTELQFFRLFQIEPIVYTIPLSGQP